MQRQIVCLVIMPFGKTRGEQRISDLVYDGIITPALKKAGVQGLRVDRAHRTDELIQPSLLDKLNSVPVVVADVSWNNPNVIFELGYRKALGKSFVIISMTPDESAWWLKGYPIIDATSPTAISKIAHAVRQAISESSEASELKTQLMQIANELKDVSQTNPFIDRVAAWRVSRAKTELDQIKEKHISFKAMRFTDYVGYNFTALMKILKPGETYYTVSRVKFWSDKGVEKSPFLEENKYAADRDVKIYRVIIVDSKELKKELSTKKGEMHAVLNRHYNENESSDKCRKNMMVRVLPVNNVDEAIAQYGHFGLLADRGRESLENAFALLISPVHGQNLLEGIDLRFTSGRCRDDHELQLIIQKFNTAFNNPNARDIRELFASYRKG